VRWSAIEAQRYCRLYDRPRSVPSDRLPTSRLRRSSRVGRLAASEAARQAGTRAANLVRSDEAAREALAQRQLEAAERLVATLGTMKGAAMKVGQVLSFLDVGLVPEEHREEFQRKLAALRDAAPAVRFADMRRVLEEELEGPLDEHFAAFDPEPIAAASIGQVYRAALHDGREVAVKVQYPGVAAAVRADLQNLGVLLRLARTLAPGIDPQAIGAEVRERIGDELDYETEAQHGRALARRYRGHPFIVVPEVVTALSRRRVLVTELVDGRGFAHMQALGQAERDRIGEIVFRFYFGCMYRHHQFSGDPHPGNCLLLADGRVAFLDFGLFKQIDARTAEFELETVRLAVEGRAAELRAHLHRGGLIRDPGDWTPEAVLEQVRTYTWWYLEDGELQLTPEVAAEVIAQVTDPRSEFFAQARTESLPPEHLMGRRTETLTLAVLGQLGARANWHRVAREWLYGEAPRTELGRAEAAFWERG
jgi:predicted unusual protein kinase regulating ubiquinone biosynthesis (AarF/ABC1/UbiB family)